MHLSLLLHPQGDRRRNRARHRGAAHWRCEGPMARSIRAPAAICPQSERAARIARGESYAMRLDAAEAAAVAGPLTFVEHGHERAVDPLLFGDVVLARKDYAGVLSSGRGGGRRVSGREPGDARRGSCCRQPISSACCRRCWDYAAPAYAHHRLILDEDGRKFSKRDRAVTLRSLRDAGVSPAGVAARF